MLDQVVDVEVLAYPAEEGGWVGVVLDDNTNNNANNPAADLDALVAALGLEGQVVVHKYPSPDSDQSNGSVVINAGCSLDIGAGIDLDDPQPDAA